MSIITAIFQAIVQALTWLLPISESGHSGLFHNFSGRFSGACSALTGVVHIGIAVGIIAASYGLFFRLSKESFFTIRDLFGKKLKGSSKQPARSFLYMSFLSFLPMLLWLIPVKGEYLYTILNKTASNSTVLDEGISFLITGALVLVTAKQLKLSCNNGNIGVIAALVSGVAAVFLVPVSGLSLTAGVFSLLVILCVSKKSAYRLTIVMSVPVLIVMGISEICVSVTAVTAVQTIVATVVSVIFGFFATKIFKYIVIKNNFKYFGIYDISLGVLATVIGIFQLALN